MVVAKVQRIGTWAMKTLSSTIHNGLKKEAGGPSRLRNFIINLTQANHRFAIQVQRQLYDRPTNVPIRRLDDEKVVKDAAELLVKLFLYFSAAGAGVIYHIHRKEEREKGKKEAAQRDELHMQELQEFKTAIIRELKLLTAQVQVELHEMKIVELEQKLEEMDRHTKGLEETVRQTKKLEVVQLVALDAILNFMRTRCNEDRKIESE